MKSTVLVTGAATGIGHLTAYTLAAAGHTVYASMRDIKGKNAERAEQTRARATKSGVDLRALELDVTSQASADSAIQAILDAQGRLDVIVHNAGHLCVGVTEAFTAEQVLQLFDTNTVGAHRVNRAALPHMREVESGLLIYVGSTTTRMAYPFMGPYEASKSAFDVMAQVTKYEVARFGIDVVIIMPGAFTKGTEHFPDAMHPGDAATEAAYRRISELAEQQQSKLAAMTPPEADPQAVADEIRRLVNLPAGSRPFRPMVDFLGDGAAEVNAVADEMQTRLMKRLGLEDMLTPSAAGG